MKDYERSTNGRRPMMQRPPARPVGRRTPTSPRMSQPPPTRSAPGPARRTVGTPPKTVRQAGTGRPVPPLRAIPPRGAPTRRPPFWRRRRGTGGWGPRFNTWYHFWDDPTLPDDRHSTDGRYGANTALPSNLRGVGAAGRRALWRSGLLNPGWGRLLSQAPEALIQFIRHFWQIAGFEYVVKAFFGNRLQKQAAIMTIRLTRLAAERNPGAGAQIVFTQDVGYAAGAGAFLSIQMQLNGRYFIPLPWTELDERTVRKQFACHQKLFGDDAFRWVLSGSALGMQKDEVMRRLKELLEATTSDQVQTNAPDQEGDELERLQKMVIFLP